VQDTAPVAAEPAQARALALCVRPDWP